MSGTPHGLRPASFADQVYGRILEEIIEGHFPQGEKMPAEKELCSRFGVSRPVVRSALARLRLDGLVEARRGSGTYVLSRPSGNLVRLTEFNEFSAFLRYQELRLSIEGSAAALAAERRTEQDLARIVDAQNLFERHLRAGEFSPEPDRGFHLAVAAATGNAMFGHALESAAIKLSDFMRITLSLTSVGSEDRMLKVLREHEEVIEAIRARDPIAARVAMEHHILQAKRRITNARIDP